LYESQKKSKQEKKQTGDKKQESNFVATDEPLIELKELKSNLLLACSPHGNVYGISFGWAEKDKPFLIVVKLQSPLKIFRFSVYANMTKFDATNPGALVCIHNDYHICFFSLREVVKNIQMLEGAIFGGAEVTNLETNLVFCKSILVSDPAHFVSCAKENIFVACAQDVYMYLMSYVQ